MIPMEKMALGFFAVRQFTVRKKNLTEPNKPKII